jgi:hypothetical protein
VEARELAAFGQGVFSIERVRGGAGLLVEIGTDIAFENEKRYPSDYLIELRLFKETGYTDAEII